MLRKNFIEYKYIYIFFTRLRILMFNERKKNSRKTAKNRETESQMAVHTDGLILNVYAKGKQDV